jgi:hypothetical protein
MDFWTDADISFPRSSDGRVDFDNPLIRRSFGSRGIDLSMLAQSLPRPYLSSSIPCLFSLGVVLLELWYQNTLANMKNESEKALVWLSISLAFLRSRKLMDHSAVSILGSSDSSAFS